MVQRNNVLPDFLIIVIIITKFKIAYEQWLGSLLSTSHALTSRNYHHLHFTGEEPEAQRASVPSMNGPCLSLQLYLAFIFSSVPLARCGPFAVHHTCWFHT